MAEKKDAAALAQAIVQKTEVSTTTSPTPAGPTDASEPPTQQGIEAINQVFGLFRLNYHNQYYARGLTPSRSSRSNGSGLRRSMPIPPPSILRAAQHAIETSDYLPTLNRMIDACRHGMSDLGLPVALRRLSRGLPRAVTQNRAAWRHPAVYLAGATVTGFFWPMKRRSKPGLSSRPLRALGQSCGTRRATQGPERVAHCAAR